ESISREPLPKTPHEIRGGLERDSPRASSVRRRVGELFQPLERLLPARRILRGHAGHRESRRSVSDREPFDVRRVPYFRRTAKEHGGAGRRRRRYARARELPRDRVELALPLPARVAERAVAHPEPGQHAEI